jgi:hypothetical protein
MGRGDQDKRLRRVGEQVDKSLARRDLESAIDAVLGLEKGLREPLLSLVAPAFRRTVVDLQKTAAWGRLHTLAARSEQEPRLLLLGADEAAAAAARWPLLLASMRSRDFARATRIWKELIAPVTARAPALARAMAAWIEGQGQIGLDAVAGLDLDALPALPAPDARLGIESSGRARPTPPPAPTSVSEVDRALYALFASQPLSAVADTLWRWLACSPVDLAKALRARAGSLFLREVLILASAKESVALPATLLARASEGVEDDVASELLLATRLLVTAVACKSSRRGEPEALATLAGALVRTKQVGEVAGAVVADFSAIPELVPTAQAACQSALAQATSLSDERLFSFWASALFLSGSISGRDREDPVPVAGPAWLQMASREACKRGPALASFLEMDNGDLQDLLLDELLWGQPSEIVADLIDAVWDHASERLRRELSELLPDLIQNAEEAGMHALDSSHSLRDMAAFDRIAEACETADPTLPFMALGGLVLWRRLGLRSLPYCVRLLPFALSQTAPGQRMEAVQAQVGKGADIEAWLEAIRELSACDPDAISPLVEQTVRAMLDRFRDDRTAFARALAYAERFGAPLGLLKRLGHAYQRAALAQDADSVEATPDDRRATEILRSLFGGGLKKRPTKRPTKPKGRTRGAACDAAGQLALPLGEDER